MNSIRYLRGETKNRYSNKKSVMCYKSDIPVTINVSRSNSSSKTENDKVDFKKVLQS